MISLTETAAEKVRKLAAGDAEARVLRLAVEGGGCSGFQYAVGFDTAAEDDDLQWESNGVTIVVDRISLPYLDGSTVDYSDGLIGAGFRFDNPNVAASCGCNASFQAKEGVEGPYSPKEGGSGCG
jgi:iron-sulfur cluster assembly accessory protein